MKNENAKTLWKNSSPWLDAYGQSRAEVIVVRKLNFRFVLINTFPASAVRVNEGQRHLPNDATIFPPDKVASSSVPSMIARPRAEAHCHLAGDERAPSPQPSPPGEGEASSVLSKSWWSLAFAAPHCSSAAKQELPLLGERVGGEGECVSCNSTFQSNETPLPHCRFALVIRRHGG